MRSPTFRLAFTAAHFLLCATSALARTLDNRDSALEGTTSDVHPNMLDLERRTPQVSPPDPGHIVPDNTGTKRPLSDTSGGSGSTDTMASFPDSDLTEEEVPTPTGFDDIAHDPWPNHRASAVQSGNTAWYTMAVNRYPTKAKIECGGDLPPESTEFPWPAFFHVESFSSNQHLCADWRNGGNPLGNAGGYCQKPPTEGVMAFRDSYGSRSHELAEGSFLVAPGTTLRQHCTSHCKCAEEAPLPAAETELLPITKGDKQADTSANANANPTSGARGATQSGSSTSSSKSGQPRVRPKGSGRNRSKAAKEHHRPKAQAVQPPPSGQQSSQQTGSQTCGAHCLGAGYCTDNVADPAGTGCAVCDVGKMPDSSTGAGFFYPLGCIKPFKLSDIMGRGLNESQWQNITIEDTQCACNVSYVSKRCCGAKDGIVYEPPSKKLGVVFVDDD